MTGDLINLFHSTADNIGDQMCGPAQYLWPKRFRNAPLSRGFPTQTTGAIIGGGQIFVQLENLADAAKNSIHQIKLVAWGVGLPLRGNRDAPVRKVAARLEAFSTRNYDWRDQIQFVPCASCLSPVFDACLPPQHEFVVYSHRRKPGAEGIPEGTPTLSNSMTDPQTAVNFIASGETVVTSSYHGVYWAQLLGRRVVCIPYNYKFLTFENVPTLAAPHNWASELKSAKRCRPLLEDYRSLNRAFASQVEQIWNE